MKKTVSIFMLIVFLLNVLGFYGVFLGFQFKNAQDAQRILDEETYAGSDAVTFKVPISLPYYSSSSTFDRVDGEFEHNGEVYRLVKQKYNGDTLTIVCVRDHQAGKISRAMTDYVKTFSDKPFGGKHQESKSVQDFSKDYMSSRVLVESLSSGWFKPVLFGERTQMLTSLDPSRIKYPPKSFLS